MFLLHELSLVFIVVCLALVSGQVARGSHESRSHHSPPNRNDFLELVDSFQGNTESYLHYTPSTPAPHNINCYVNVPSTVRKGGHCVQLGHYRGNNQRNSPWACQAGIHLAFSADCPRVMPPSRRGRRG